MTAHTNIYFLVYFIFFGNFYKSIIKLSRRGGDRLFFQKWHFGSEMPFFLNDLCHGNFYNKLKNIQSNPNKSKIIEHMCEEKFVRFVEFIWTIYETFQARDIIYSFGSGISDPICQFSQKKTYTSHRVLQTIKKIQMNPKKITKIWKFQNYQICVWK